MKSKIIATIIACLVLGGIYWASTVSFINVSTSGTNTTQATKYVFTKQLSGTTSTADDPENTNEVTKRLSRGNYEVIVSQGDSSYFAVVKTSGFFRTTEVTAQLQQQKSRKFVGNNPDNCMKLIEGTLISYTCNDIYSNIKTHVPATAQTPTITMPNPNVAAGTMEGIIHVKAATFVLLQWPSFGETEPRQSIYRIGSDLVLKDQVDLADLSGDTSYGISPYKEGFVVYDTAYSKALYYTSPSSKPSEIKLDKPSDSSLSASSFDVEANDITLLYTSSTDTSPSKASSEAIIVKDGQSTHYTFKKKPYSKAQLCGTSKLCLFGNKQVDVYDISEEKPKYLYQVDSVNDMVTVGSSLLLSREKDILSLDANAQAGYVDYSFGDYSVNTIEPTDTGYLLNLTNNKNKKVALYIDRQTKNVDSIDKKVAELQKIPQISDLSINGFYIFITPELGDPIYSEDLQSFIDDPITLKNATKTINDEIANQEIKSPYKIINTAL